jgi:serine/threonine protein kinase
MLDSHAALPESIGGYQIVRRTAHGAFGVVYFAIDEKLSSEVAIKLPRRTQNADVSAGMLREARMLAKLRHPNIVRVLTANQTESGDFYIVMDWIDGETLQEKIRSGSLTVRQCVEIIAKVSDAIHVAHKSGFIHRDIKPSNILLDRQGNPFVSDFGLALDDRIQRSRRDEFAGTLAYMSPEQVRCESQYLDGRTDVWALGVTLYEMIAQTRPFHGDREQLADEICNREPRPLRIYNDQLPSGLAEVVLGCLAKEIGKRTATAADLRDSLNQILRSDSQSTSLPPRPGNRFSRLPGVVAIVSLLIAVGLGATAWRWGNVKPDSLPEKISEANSLISTMDRAPRPAFRGDADALQLSRWNKLFDRPLKRLRWSDQAFGSLLVEDFDLEQISLIATDHAILEAAQIRRPNIRVSVNWLQPEWQGRLSIYYGWHKIDTGFECEMLTFDRIPDDNGQYMYVLQRFIEKYKPDYFFNGATGLSSAVLSHPGVTRTELTLKFEQGFLSSVTWGGKALESLTEGEFIAAPLRCEGGMGIMLVNSAATISQFRVFCE